MTRKGSEWHLVKRIPELLRFCIGAFLFIGVLPYAGTSACLAAASKTEIHFSAAQLFGIADKAIAESNVDAAITLYKAIEQDANVDIRNEARFRHAKLLEQRQKLTDAAVLYRAILDDKPNAARVRVELAALLSRMGDLAGARHQLRQAQAEGLPPEVAQVVNQYVAALRSLKPWGGSFELALAPDSNINRATDAKTLDTVIAPLNLSRDARERSGLGLKGSGQLYARANLSKDLALVPRVSGLGTLYRENQFNDISGSAQLGLEWRVKSDRLTLSAGHTWRWYGGDLYARTQNFSVDLLHPTGKRAQIDLDIGVSRVRYLRNDFQSGMIYNASMAYERALTARSGASLSVSTRADSDHSGSYPAAIK